jgi:hypothetical protein
MRVPRRKGIRMWVPKRKSCVEGNVELSMVLREEGEVHHSEFGEGGWGLDDMDGEGTDKNEECNTK